MRGDSSLPVTNPKFTKHLFRIRNTSSSETMKEKIFTFSSISGRRLWGDTRFSLISIFSPGGCLQLMKTMICFGRDITLRTRIAITAADGVMKKKRKRFAMKDSSRCPPSLTSPCPRTI
ncbi:hypothetical protein ACFE04_026288 [Oxalis oulophora]